MSTAARRRPAAFRPLLIGSAADCRPVRLGYQPDSSLLKGTLHAARPAHRLLGLGLAADEQLQLVREAESLGFDSVWSAEAYGSDAATVLAWIAGQTEKIKLGSAIFQMPGRSPAMTAMTA